MKANPKNQKIIQFHKKPSTNIEKIAADLIQQQDNVKEAMIIYLDNNEEIHYQFTYIHSFTRMLGFLEYLKHKLLQE